MFSELIAANHIPAALSGRPYDYGRENTMKIIVLMTDGEHFQQERMNPGYRSGLSGIWRASNGEYSIFHPSRVNRSSASTIAESRPFWVPRLGQWHPRPHNGIDQNPSSMPYAEGTLRRFDVNGDGVCTNSDDGRGTLQANEACWSLSTEQTWTQVWSAVRVSWVAQQLYARAGIATYNDQMNRFRSQVPTATMDAQLEDLCERAREEEIIVYGIAFEAPAGAQDLIEACAYLPSYYFFTTTSEIDTTFSAIASNINALRLMQ
jgi:hypothetical protein